MVIVLFLLIGVFAGCISADIANAKHRDALGWFFIGFLFPLLGVILAIVMSPNPVPTPAPAAPPSEVAPVDGAARAAFWWKPDAK